MRLFCYEIDAYKKVETAKDHGVKSIPIFLILKFKTMLTRFQNGVDKHNWWINTSHLENIIP